MCRYCLSNSCLTFLTADSDNECRRRARLVWTVEEERQKSEVPDSTGIRRQARNQERVVNEGNSTLGLTEWLVPTILLVSVEEYSDGSVRRSP
jgi:hypothetical protein